MITGKQQKTQNAVLNMTEGKILPILLSFALPILIGNAFQQLYNVVDTAVIGNILGDEALAAVGATSAVYSLMIGFTNGMSNGFSVVIARHFGSGDEEQLHRVVNLTFLLALIISGALTLASIFFLHPLLVFLKTPDEILVLSEQYISLIMRFVSVTMLYNMLAGMLRALGNSRIPLYVLILSSIVNVILDIVFVKYCGMGVRGAAFATVLAQVLSVLLTLIYIILKCPLLHLKLQYFTLSLKLIGELLSTGFSMAMMLVLTNIGTVAMQGAVNSLGTQVITGHTAARKIHDLFMLPMGTICTSAATFVSQNYGAKKPDRIHQGIKISLWVGTVWSGIALLIVLFLGKPLIIALTGTEDNYVVQICFRYLITNVPFYTLVNILLVYRNSLQGLNQKIVPVVASTMELIGKFVGAFVFVPLMDYWGICIIEPITWVATIPVVAISFYRVSHRLNEEIK